MSFPCIITDESVDARICKALQKDGYNIYSISSNHNGIDDIKVIELAVIKEAIIVTEDKELGNVIANKKTLHKGTLLLLLPGLSIAEKNSLVFKVFLNYKDELINAFTILTPQQLKIRKNFL